ncbi:unnamed protein product [Caenorhabditis bovis]|uniref:Short-chain dehydrogenase/reductase 3 n=1 Tax=Caenorhabditis bovis TaxID=2654633 RepID=A0A8S1E3Y8_9PELO|nr:unnamed protein product [Caenorhabditis bovis]
MCQLFRGIVIALKFFYFVVESIVLFLTPAFLMKKKNIKGQNVLITGTGSGVGRELAKEFAKYGCNVIMWDVNTAGNEETLRQLRDMGFSAKGYTVDISIPQRIYKAADLVKQECGKVDIVINNAGIANGKGLFDCTDEMIERSFAINAKSHFHIAKCFLPGMLETNNGHIVTVASIAGKVASAGLIDYTASKHGVVGFHDSLTAEIVQTGKTGVMTTLVCPYYINTNMFDGNGVKTKIPSILAVLEQDYVARKILESVLINREYIAMPRIIHFLIAGGGLLPRKAAALLADSIELVQSTDRFNRSQN